MKTLIIDGQNMAWRAHHAIHAELSTGGKPVKVVYGFLRSLRDSLDQFEPNHAIVCWDSGKPQYRLSIYPLYKAHRRSGIPEEQKERKAVYQQIEVIKKLLPLLGVYQVHLDNTEADDLIAAACNIKELGLKIILSGDKDLLQLVRRGVRVYSPNHNYLYRWTTFKKKTGLTPKQYFEMRVLCGDPSDNIPPIQKGIGEKTAFDLVKIAPVPELLHGANRDKVKRLSARHNYIYLTDSIENYSRNARLMTLHNVTEEQEATMRMLYGCMEDFPLSVNIPRVKEEFMKRQFRSILAEFGSWIVPFKGLT